MCDTQYESGGRFTVGGPTGAYVLHSPFNTECEFCVYAITANGVGLVAISGANPALLQMTAANPTLGLASGGMDSNAFEGLLLQLSNPFVFMPLEDWHPLGRGANINVAITLLSGDCYVMISIRRLAKHVIPRIAPTKPHTHVPLSGKLSRTFYEGFNEATPGETGASSDPEPHQDTGTFRRNVAYVSRADHNPMSALDRKVSKRR